MKAIPLLTGMMSGSMGACVASHNRGGQYFRQRVIPTNPNTTRQNAVRGYFSAAVVAWTNTLTAPQRLAWKTWADNVPMTDVLGQTFYLTGQQAYIRTNVPRFQLGLTAVNAAPIIFNNGEPIAGFDSTVLTLPNTMGIITATAAFSSTAFFMAAATAAGQTVIYMGPPVGAGVNFYKGRYQFAATETFIAAATDTPFTTTTVEQFMAVPILAAQRRPLRIRNLYNDGRISDPFSIIAPVVSDAV